MIKVMLDTNICIYAIKHQSASLLAKLKSYQIGEVAISSIVYSELMYGVYNSERVEHNLEKLNHFLNALTVLEYDERSADFYGKTKAHLRSKGKMIGPNDLFIAAHALSKKLPLATNNEKEFSRVPGLKVEQWC